MSTRDGDRTRLRRGLHSDPLTRLPYRSFLYGHYRSNFNLRHRRGPGPQAQVGRPERGGRGVRIRASSSPGAPATSGATPDGERAPRAPARARWNEAPAGSRPERGERDLGADVLAGLDLPGADVLLRDLCRREARAASARQRKPVEAEARWGSGSASPDCTEIEGAALRQK